MRATASFKTLFLLKTTQELFFTYPLAYLRCFVSILSVYARSIYESLATMANALNSAQTAFDTSFEARLAKIDLSAVMAHVATDTGLGGEDLARAEQLYRQFLTLKARFPQTSFVPPKLVDEVWHTHITFTRQYMADCELLFGEYMHHTPDLAGAEDLFETTTVPAYQAEFGVNLKAYGVLADIAKCG